MSRKLAAADKKFLARVTEAGGEVLAPTNPYEVMRFKTSLGVGVVYEKANGQRTWNTEAAQVREHLAACGGSLAPVEVKGRRKGKGSVARLIERDGSACFFCGLALGDDITVEHLVAVAHGGPNHISNLFLAHGECNRAAGHLSAPEKVAIALERRAA
ncbi:HNH endonuclease [Sphingomonas sp.]|uniref:HNH endonuclease n=1 Tax=Sphingomonas sp. TaxID=28214 RepID=UPI002FD8E1A6